MKKKALSMLLILMMIISLFNFGTWQIAYAGGGIINQDGFSSSGELFDYRPLGDDFDILTYKNMPNGYNSGFTAFNSGVFDGQYVWLIPYNSNYVVKVDKDKGTTTGYNDWPENIDVGSYHSFSGGIFDGQNIWMIPYISNGLVKIDKDTGEMTGYDNWPSGFTKYDNPFIGGVYDGRYIWMVSQKYEQIVKFDTLTEEMRLIEFTPTDVVYNSYNHYGGVTYDGKNIWLAPDGADAVIKFDTQTESVVSYKNWPSGYVVETMAFRGCVYDGNSIWLIPYSVEMLVKVDKNTGAMTGYGIDMFPESSIKNGLAFSGGIYDGESIWLIPQNQYFISKVNKATGVITTYNAPEIKELLSKNDYYGGVYDGEKLWMVPFTSPGTTTTIVALEGVPIRITPSESLSEPNLDTNSLSVKLNAYEFEDATLDKANFKLLGAPEGLSIEKVTYIDSNNAIVDLAFTGRDFDVTFRSFGIEIDGSELLGGEKGTSNTLIIAAEGDSETLTLSQPESIFEGSEDGKKITVTLKGGQYASVLTKENWSLQFQPEGVTIGSVERVNDTTATITLSGNATQNYDANIYRVKVSCTKEEYIDSTNGGTISKGSGLIFTAVENPETLEANVSNSTPKVGEGSTITLTAKNASGEVFTAFNGVKAVSVRGVASASDDSYGSLDSTVLTDASETTGQTVLVNFSNGFGTAVLKLNSATEQEIVFSCGMIVQPDAAELTMNPIAGEAVTMSLSQDIKAPLSMGGAFSVQPSVVLKDKFGNTCIGDSSTMILVNKADAGDWTLGGTTLVKVINGVATFTNLTADSKAEVSGAKLKFTAAGLSGIESGSVTLSGAALAQMVTATVGKTASLVGDTNVLYLTVKNSLDQVDTTFSGSKSVTIKGVKSAPYGMYGILGNTQLTEDAKTAGQSVMVPFENGKATISLTLFSAEEQHINLSVNAVSNSAIDVLVFDPQPEEVASLLIVRDIEAPSENGGKFAVQPIVALLDNFGNMCRYNHSTVVTAKKLDDGAWTLTGKTSVVSDSGGIFFSDLGAENSLEVSGAQISYSTETLTTSSSAVVLKAKSDGETGRTYSIRFETDGGTNIGEQVVNSGDHVMRPLFDPSKEGYVFSGWYTDLSYKNLFDFNNTIVTSNRVIYAKWNPIGELASPQIIKIDAGDSKVGLTWNLVSGATGYKIFKRTESEVFEEAVAIVGADIYQYSVPNLTNGMLYYFVVKAINGEGESANSNEVSAKPVSTSGGGSGGSSGGGSGGGSDRETSSGGGTAASSAESSKGVEVFVNGKPEASATATEVKGDNGSVTNVVINEEMILANLENQGNNAVVSLPMTGDPNIVVGGLTGKIIKAMEMKSAVLEIKTDGYAYRIPASQIKIDLVSEKLGTEVALDEIKINIKINKSTANTIQSMEQTATQNQYKIVGEPLDFEITCTAGNQEVTVDKFNGYVEKSVTLPSDINLSQVTTGIVFNQDGSFSHVPTKVVKEGETYYAKINSLTNSTYSVIWNQVTFKDVSGHWAEEAINDMGSRLVVTGTGGGNYTPNRDVTRAEFVTMLVKGLGLMKPGTGQDVFEDVTKDAWYYDAVSIAASYDLISGVSSERFNPADNITREQAMTIISKAMALTGLKDEKFDVEIIESLLSSFSDAGEASSWSREQIAACIKMGIVGGRSADELAPKAHVTRAEVAVMIQKLLQKSNLI